jgi:hypothetical protein
MTPQQYDKQLYIEKHCNAWKERKNEHATLVIEMDLDLDNDLDLDRMCTLIIHPCISSTCIHTSN